MKSFEYSRINGYTILKDVIKNFWVILLAAYVGFMSSMTYFTYLRPKQYTSTMTLSVNLSGYTSASTASTLSRTIDIAQTLDEVFHSDALLEIIRKDLGTNNIGTITAAQSKNTNLIQVSATGSTAQAAFDTLKSVLENYQKVTDFVFSNVVIRAVVHPSMPTAPSNSISPFGASLLLSLVFAFLTSVSIVLISYLRDTVKNISEVERDLDAKLFGTVYHTKLPFDRKNPHKHKMTILNPLVDFQFSENYRRMAIKIESLKRTKNINSYAITSIAENEGKTTAALNIAMALAQNNSRVLLIDCDFKNPSIYHFFERENRPEKSNFHNFITDGGEISDFIYKDPNSGLYVADSFAPCEASSEKLSHTRFVEAIKTLKKQFDFVIVDTPPCGITVDAEIVSENVDALLMVVHQDVVRVSEINDHLEAFNKTYVAGCIFNNIKTLRKIASDGNSDSSKYYYHGHI